MALAVILGGCVALEPTEAAETEAVTEELKPSPRLSKKKW